MSPCSSTPARPPCSTNSSSTTSRRTRFRGIFPHPRKRNRQEPRRYSRLRQRTKAERGTLYSVPRSALPWVGLLLFGCLLGCFLSCFLRCHLPILPVDKTSRSEERRV